MAYLIDSHAHLDQCAEPAIALKVAREQGLARILAVGFDLETSRRAALLAGKHPEVCAAVGIHPHDARATDDETMAELAALSAGPGVAAIGETGLDYYRDRSPRDVQRESFLRHIGLARATGLTLIVHSREASGDTLDILENHAEGLRVVLHCFSLYDQLEECARRRYFMSVAGNVTFANAKGLRQAVPRIPEDLILTETDSPWLTPVPHRGKPNLPANVRFVLEEISRLRKTPAAAMAKQVFANFQAAFPSC